MANNQQLLLGEGAGGGIPNYIEEVFSTYLYTGNGSTQTITNGINLSTKGGMVWNKTRDVVSDFGLYDTARGTAAGPIRSNNTNGQWGGTYGVTAFNSNGVDLGAQGSFVNGSGEKSVLWTFRKQPKFFDIVTYTGDGVGGRQIPHALGGTIGAVIIKCTSLAVDWVMWHRSQSLKFGVLNTTAEFTTTDAPFRFGDNSIAIDPTNSVITVGGSNKVNSSGATYVAYIFAHDAGGFGLAGTDKVISCGSFTTDGSGVATVSLGYEPQWLMAKASGAVENWYLEDNMRGFPVDGTLALLQPNGSNAEASTTNFFYSRATGFVAGSTAGSNLSVSTTYIYIAIRRGPMKVPTVGTSVFSPLARSGANSGSRVFTGIGFPPDLVFNRGRTSASDSTTVVDRLRGGGSTAGVTPVLRTALTNAEGTIGGLDFSNNMDGFLLFDDGQANWSNSAYTYINWNFRRAPGFFDEVCYTGNGASGRTIAHNLGVAPEMMILKSRSDSGTNYQWFVYHKDIPPTPYATNLVLNGTAAAYAWSEIIKTPTTTTFGINDSFGNTSAATYVAYLFATCAGVSKVGSYTGNGSSQTIACGFTAGSRFVMIKRTDSTGDWYVWDSARGIIAGNDPHLSLNTTVAEVTTDDSVDTDNSGFIVNQVAATNVNVTSATYIFLAIA